MLLQLLRRLLNRNGVEFGVKIISTLLGALALNVLFGTLFYFAERNVQEDLSYADSIWWGMVTMTTVGYGDLYPQTFAGRFLIAYPCFLIGIGVIGYLLGSIADTIIQIAQNKKSGQHATLMQNHIIICYCPNVDKILNLREELIADEENQNLKFVVITPDLDTCPACFEEHGISFVQGDPTDEDILDRANINGAQGVIILARNPLDPMSDALTFTVGSLVRSIKLEHDLELRVIAELLDQDNERLIRRAKIDSSITLQGITDKMLAQEYLSPGMNRSIGQLITQSEGNQFYLCSTQLAGHTLIKVQQAALGHECPLQVVGIHRGKKALLNPAHDTKILESDQLLVLAKTQEHYDSFEQSYLQVSEGSTD